MQSQASEGAIEPKIKKDQTRRVVRLWPTGCATGLAVCQSLFGY